MAASASPKHDPGLYVVAVEVVVVAVVLVDNVEVEDVDVVVTAGGLVSRPVVIVVVEVAVLVVVLLAVVEVEVVVDVHESHITEQIFRAKLPSSLSSTQSSFEMLVPQVAGSRTPKHNPGV